MKFEYSVIRVMPSPVTTKSLNVGVIVKSDDRADMTRASALSRIWAAFPTIDKQAVEISLAHLQEQLQANTTLDLWALSRSTDGALVQVGPPAITTGDSIDLELTELSDLYVGGTANGVMTISGSTNGHSAPVALSRGRAGRR